MQISKQKQNTNKKDLGGPRRKGNLHYRLQNCDYPVMVAGVVAVCSGDVDVVGVVVEDLVAQGLQPVACDVVVEAGPRMGDELDHQDRKR